MGFFFSLRPWRFGGSLRIRTALPLGQDLQRLRGVGRRQGELIHEGRAFDPEDLTHLLVDVALVDADAVRILVANRLTDAIYSYGAEPSMATAWIPGHGPKLKAVVFDASDLLHTDQLKQLREFFQPLMKNLDHCAHLVILGRDPQTLRDPFAASAQRAL